MMNHILKHLLKAESSYFFYHSAYILPLDVHWTFRGWEEEVRRWTLVWGILGKSQENMKTKKVKRRKQERRWFSGTVKAKRQLILVFSKF